MEITDIIKYTLLALAAGLGVWLAKRYGKDTVIFVKGSIDEMTTNVTWSKYSELQSSTILVIWASFLFATLIGLVDLLFKTIMEYIN